VITGFNTDIEHEGVTYHVQTEDKGVATPLILTLVYDRGTILASKRSPYEDLLADNFDEQVLVERLKKQHKLICGAIRAGRLEDLKRMTAKESESRKNGLAAQKEVSIGNGRQSGFVAPELGFEEIPMPSILEGKSLNFQAATATKTAFDGAVWDVPLEVVEESAVEFVKPVKIAEDIILPAEAVEIIIDPPKEDPTDNAINIELLNEIVFKGGERKTVNLLVWRGKRENALNGAQILVKVIGASFRPLIFHSKTDGNGVASVNIQLPYFKAGRAAVLIKAISDGDEVEVRRTIRQA
jgi:hypothetical protein